MSFKSFLFFIGSYRLITLLVGYISGIPKLNLFNYFWALLEESLVLSLKKQLEVILTFIIVAEFYKLLCSAIGYLRSLVLCVRLDMFST